MCTTTETPQTQRTVSELLNLGTYQGMTDAEIDSIIDFKINDAVNTYKYDELANLQRDNAVAMQEQLDHYAQVTENVLQLFLDKGISLPEDDIVETIPALEISSQTVQPKQVTFNDMEVSNG